MLTHEATTTQFLHRWEAGSRIEEQEEKHLSFDNNDPVWQKRENSVLLRTWMWRAKISRGNHSCAFDWQTLHTHVTFDLGVKEVLVFYNSEEVCVFKSTSERNGKEVTSPKPTAPLSRWVDSTHDITLANFFYLSFFSFLLSSLVLDWINPSEDGF